MKQLCGVLIMLTIIFFIAFSANRYLKDSTEELKDNLGEVRKYVESSDWSKAKTINKKITERWNDASRIIPVIKDQGELHNLVISLTRISGLIEQENKEELLLEITVARKLLTAIYEQEKLSPGNVF